MLAFGAPSAGASGFRLFPASVPASHFFTAYDPDGQAGFRTFHLVRSRPWEAADPDTFRLDLQMAAPADTWQELPPLAPISSRKQPRLFTTKTILLSAGVLVGASLYAMTSPWNHGFTSYHFDSEHFFGPNTYAGGADKGSHFIVSASLARELALVFDREGHSPAQSNALSAGLTVLSGLVVEVGDGFSPYGFSWEDMTANVLGTTTGLLLTRNGLNDLIGLRAGKVATDVPVPCCHEPYLGFGYSSEIYSADLKIAGLARRLNFRPGLARFLLTSVTYSTKGYGYVPPLPDRQRLVGFELGLNMPEILSAAGVPKTTWWGSFLYKALNFFRIPFTSFGFRYDLNRGRWHGPDTGNRYYR
jgi:hypothetical protein